MKIPLEITFRGVPKTQEIEDLIRKKASKLERICNYMSSCRVAVENPQKHQHRGNPYRVRIDMTVPPSHELVVRRESSKGDLHDELPKVIRDAFGAARRQVQTLVERQRGEIKTHPQQQPQGFISKMFPEESYGFIRTVDGREIYFHKNSVLNEGFEHLSIGTGVNFVEEQGVEGPQASTVRVVDKPEHP
ncbi:MAG: HPF/RaiA family ribosome-associated protein [Spirochaetota bacterium]